MQHQPTTAARREEGIKGWSFSWHATAEQDSHCSGLSACSACRWRCARSDSRSGNGYDRSGCGRDGCVFGCIQWTPQRAVTLWLSHSSLYCCRRLCVIGDGAGMFPWKLAVVPCAGNKSGCWDTGSNNHNGYQKEDPQHHDARADSRMHIEFAWGDNHNGKSYHGQIGCRSQACYGMRNNSICYCRN